MPSALTPIPLFVAVVTLRHSSAPPHCSSCLHLAPSQIIFHARNPNGVPDFINCLAPRIQSTSSRLASNQSFVVSHPNFLALETNQLSHPTKCLAPCIQSTAQFLASNQSVVVSHPINFFALASNQSFVVSHPTDSQSCVTRRAPMATAPSLPARTTRGEFSHSRGGWRTGVLEPQSS